MHDKRLRSLARKNAVWGAFFGVHLSKHLWDRFATWHLAVKILVCIIPIFPISLILLAVFDFIANLVSTGPKLVYNFTKGYSKFRIQINRETDLRRLENDMNRFILQLNVREVPDRQQIREWIERLERISQLLGDAAPVREINRILDNLQRLLGLIDSADHASATFRAAIDDRDDRDAAIERMNGIIARVGNLENNVLMQRVESSVEALKDILVLAKETHALGNVIASEDQLTGWNKSLDAIEQGGFVEQADVDALREQLQALEAHRNSIVTQERAVLEEVKRSIAQLQCLPAKDQIDGWKTEVAALANLPQEEMETVNTQLEKLEALYSQFNAMPGAFDSEGDKKIAIKAILDQIMVPEKGQPLYGVATLLRQFADELIEYVDFSAELDSHYGTEQAELTYACRKSRNQPLMEWNEKTTQISESLEKLCPSYEGNAFVYLLTSKLAYDALFEKQDIGSQALAKEPNNADYIHKAQVFCSLVELGEDEDNLVSAYRVDPVFKANVKKLAELQKQSALIESVLFDGAEDNLDAILQALQAEEVPNQKGFMARFVGIFRPSATVDNGGGGGGGGAAPADVEPEAVAEDVLSAVVCKVREALIARIEAYRSFQLSVDRLGEIAQRPITIEAFEDAQGQLDALGGVDMSMQHKLYQKGFNAFVAISYAHERQGMIRAQLKAGDALATKYRHLSFAYGIAKVAECNRDPVLVEALDALSVLRNAQDTLSSFEVLDADALSALERLQTIVLDGFEDLAQAIQAECQVMTAALGQIQTFLQTADALEALCAKVKDNPDRMKDLDEAWDALQALQVDAQHEVARQERLGACGALVEEAKRYCDGAAQLVMMQRQLEALAANLTSVDAEQLATCPQIMAFDAATLHEDLREGLGQVQEKAKVLYVLGHAHLTLQSFKVQAAEYEALDPKPAFGHDRITGLVSGFDGALGELELSDEERGNVDLLKALMDACVALIQHRYSQEEAIVVAGGGGGGAAVADAEGPVDATKTLCNGFAGALQACQAAGMDMRASADALSSQLYPPKTVGQHIGGALVAVGHGVASSAIVVAGAAVQVARWMVPVVPLTGLAIYSVWQKKLPSQSQIMTAVTFGEGLLAYQQGDRAALRQVVRGMACDINGAVVRYHSGEGTEHDMRNVDRFLERQYRQAKRDGNIVLTSQGVLAESVKVRICAEQLYEVLGGVVQSATQDNGLVQGLNTLKLLQGLLGGLPGMGASTSALESGLKGLKRASSTGKAVDAAQALIIAESGDAGITADINDLVMGVGKQLAAVLICPPGEEMGHVEAAAASAAGGLKAMAGKTLQEVRAIIFENLKHCPIMQYAIGSAVGIGYQQIQALAAWWNEPASMDAIAMQEAALGWVLRQDAQLFGLVQCMGAQVALANQDRLDKMTDAMMAKTLSGIMDRSSTALTGGLVKLPLLFGVFKQVSSAVGKQVVAIANKTSLGQRIAGRGLGGRIATAFMGATPGDGGLVDGLVDTLKAQLEGARESLAQQLEGRALARLADAQRHLMLEDVSSGGGGGGGGGAPVDHAIVPMERSESDLMAQVKGALPAFVSHVSGMAIDRWKDGLSTKIATEHADCQGATFKGIGIEMGARGAAAAASQISVGAAIGGAGAVVTIGAIKGAQAARQALGGGAPAGNGDVPALEDDQRGARALRPGSSDESAEEVD